MVAPWAALPAGAFVAGQAEVHGRELLAELPLVSELPFSRAGPVLGHREDWACGSLGASVLAALGEWVSPPREAGDPKLTVLACRPPLLERISGAVGGCGGWGYETR